MSDVSGALLEWTMSDDLHARRLLEGALGAFQKWPEGFTGFSAAIRCLDGDDRIDGEVRVRTGGRVEIRLAHDALAACARQALAEISVARTPRFFKDDDGRFPVAFEPDDRHPLGRGVRVHRGDAGWRTYRIDPKGRIRQQETVGLARRATATYDGFIRACPGRLLPTRIQRVDWDVRTRTVIQTTDIEDAYQRHEHVWLPVRRHMTLSQGAVRREIGFELSGHVLFESVA